MAFFILIVNCNLLEVREEEAAITLCTLKYHKIYTQQPGWILLCWAVTLFPTCLTLVQYYVKRRKLYMQNY
ncbi:hypothetical protein Y1Q_0016558 [Alligator mississippiensis]|uniref:Uncharacterized protein n=1 Tax=Alligator mississippiensis TaxID=8496 RepID=A0A151N3T1_ALLMI|nr:hypothetical protein Y1Q_0016558 [Alligator mississippiensis]